jgi:dihydrofolate reductase
MSLKKSIEKGFNIIVAHTKNRGIGYKNDLPWPRITKDMDFFRNITIGTHEHTEASGTQNCVIMGRKTWDSIPSKFRPLPNRRNVIISRTMTYEDISEDDMVTRIYRDLDNAIDSTNSDRTIHDVFVIGGGTIYESVIKHPYLNKMYIANVHGDYDVDTFFPEYPEWFKKNKTIYFDEHIDISVYHNTLNNFVNNFE